MARRTRSAERGSFPSMVRLTPWGVTSAAETLEES